MGLLLSRNRPYLPDDGEPGEGLIFESVLRVGEIIGAVNGRELEHTVILDILLEKNQGLLGVEFFQHHFPGV